MSNPPATLHLRLWALAWPLILSNITTPLLGLVDAAVLGHLDSPVYLGAVALAGNLFTFLFWAFGFLRMGATGLAAQSWGAGDQGRLIREFLRAAAIALGIGLFMILNRAWILPLGLEWMQATGDIWTQAHNYAEIRIFSAPAVLIQYCVVGWLIGCQRTRSALILAVSANIVNIALDLLFVVGFGMRADGVAWASLIAEYYSLVLGLYFVVRGDAGNFLAQLRNPELWARSAFAKLLKLNGDLFIRTILLLFTFAFFTAQGAQLGTNVLAANAVLLTFLMIISNALDGFANGVEALCGEAVGKRDQAMLRRTARIGGVWSLVTALLLTLAFWLGGDWLINRLTDLEVIRTEASRYLIWLILCPLIGVWSYLFDGVFVGATQGKAMRDTIIVATLLVFLPSWWLTQGWGNHGLWFSLCLFLAARGAYQAWLYKTFCQHEKWFITN
ncbi:MATE family efflux transporter [Hahella sp. NBU794]|uniref:MATE family efflux transporter n=1 Tax=Hahella sp. NBU794 TaxID=3422590 RepID=UPI003D6E76DF